VVVTKPIAGKKLLGVAGRHTVITDRKVEDGGTDAGCTSSDLLLLAIASCATGSIRNSPAGRGLNENDIRVEVDFVAPQQPAERDDIRISVYVPRAVAQVQGGQIVTAATAGRVVSRVKLGSQIEARCLPLEDFPSQT
jgi:uncharacterized OsmC-like protein